MNEPYTKRKETLPILRFLFSKYKICSRNFMNKEFLVNYDKICNEKEAMKNGTSFFTD